MVPVLMYHHIGPSEGAHTVSPENFREHLQFLADRRIRTLSLGEFNAWREGDLDLSQPSVLLTFDDAWLDNWTFALPILEEFGAKAVFFVVTSWPADLEPRWDLRSTKNWNQPSHAESMQLAGTPGGDEVSMRWSELLVAKDTGVVDLASHSHWHGDWWNEGSSWEETLRLLERDLEATQDEFERRLGCRSTNYCWPKGLFSNEMVRLARDYGFNTQFSTLRGGNSPSREKLVRRINVENRSADWLQKRLRLYRNKVIGHVLSLAHQRLHSVRLSRQFSDAPSNEFQFPLLVSV